MKEEMPRGAVAPRDTPAARSPSGGGEGAGTGKPKRHYRPLSERERLYRRVLELRAQGLSYRRIIGKIYEEFGERLSKSVVSYWCRRIHRPTGKVKYELKVGPDLGWLLGVVTGDGNMCFWHGGRYYDIGLKAKRELVELFAEAAAKVLGRDPPRVRPKDGLVRASLECARLYYVLSDFKELRELVESSLEMVRSFLQGLWDTEGCITEDGRLFLYNSDFLLLLWLQRLHSKVGVETAGPYLATRKCRKLRDPRDW